MPLSNSETSAPARPLASSTDQQGVSSLSASPSSTTNTQVSSPLTPLVNGQNSNYVLPEDQIPLQSLREPAQKKVFRRSYKACINCRQKKIKCDLGDLSNPSDPPCVRCKREGRKCEFSVSRRGGAGNIRVGKQKKIAAAASQTSSGDFRDSMSPEGTVSGARGSHRNKRSSSLGTSHLSYDPEALENHILEQRALEESRDHSRIGSGSGADSLNIDTENGLNNGLSSNGVITGTELHNPNDALGILVQAARSQKKIESRTPATPGSPGTAISPGGGSATASSGTKSTTASNTTPTTTSVQSHQPPHLRQHSDAAQSSQQAPGQQANQTPQTALQSADLQNPRQQTRPQSQHGTSAPHRQTSSHHSRAQQHSSRNHHHARATTTDPDSRIQFHHSIADTAVIRQKYLTEHEAILFIRFFFEQLHPFYPFVPEEMHSTEVLATMPILLTVILTISSRYCKFAEKGTKYFISTARGSQIHHSLWNYCQQLVSKTVWGEASTRSIGTVYSFLLLSEWNPRAIHWRFNDYANSPLGNTDEPPQFNTDADGSKKSKSRPTSKDSESSRPSTVGESEDNAVEPPKPVLPPGDTVFSASERSDRMSWLLIGSGIRLAQDLGVFDTNSQVYLASHLSETVLALRLGRRSMLSSWLNEETPELNFNMYEQAKLSILRIMSLAHETLYVTRKTTRNLLKGHKFLAFLNLFAPHLIHWENTYRHILSEPGLDRESILFDYHYTRLYIYSLALSNETITYPGQGESAFGSDGMLNPLLLSDGLSATKYVGMATDAAREMLAVADRVYRMDLLRLAPIRWIVRLVHAAVFLVKTVLLTPTGSMYIHKSTVAMIRRTAITLKESSPDELHLANRYSSILLHICDDMAEKCNNFKMNDEPESSSNAEPSAAAAAAANINLLNVHDNELTSQQQQDIQLLSKLSDIQKKQSASANSGSVSPSTKAPAQSQDVHSQQQEQAEPVQDQTPLQFMHNTSKHLDKQPQPQPQPQEQQPPQQLNTESTTQILLDGNSSGHQPQFGDYEQAPESNTSTRASNSSISNLDNTGPSFDDYAPFNQSRYKSSLNNNAISNNQMPQQSMMQVPSLMDNSQDSSQNQYQNDQSGGNSLFMGAGSSPFSTNFSYNGQASNGNNGPGSSGSAHASASNNPNTPGYLNFGLTPLSASSNNAPTVPTTSNFASIPVSSTATAAGTPNSTSTNAFSNDLFSITFNDISDLGFNFLADGFEGLGFVNRLVDDFELQQLNMQRQRRQSRVMGMGNGNGNNGNMNQRY